MKAFLWLPLLVLVSACNWIGNATGLTHDANKAIGAACRQTGRSLEECFLRNDSADKAQIYAGWREMNEYMVKNKLDTMVPPAEKKAASEVRPAAGKQQSMAAPAAVQLGPVPLSSEEADRQMQSDPQVNAVLSAIRERNVKAPKIGSGLEADQQRLLEIIRQAQPAERQALPG
ncbi:hypothetical protein [Craterilacuibacter sp.]|uniref:hypothetical protein n=1 Tax=Craterilacuibacter sp. TaxID=2870909 RepID=UPI003F3EBD45